MDSFDVRAGFRTVMIRRKPGGTTDERLTATVGAIEYFRLDELPSVARDASAAGLRPLIPDPRRHGGGSKDQFRIALPDRYPSGKPRTVRFTLSKTATQQTLQVLAEHLDAVGIPWLYLCNRNGGRLPNQALSSRRHWLAA